MNPTDQTPAPRTPDHEAVRRLLDGDHLRELLEIADNARAFRGDPDCVDGGCDHDPAGENGVCALLVPVYATAEHLERLHALRELVERVHLLAVDGVRQGAAGKLLAALGEIAELTEPGADDA